MKDKPYAKEPPDINAGSFPFLRRKDHLLINLIHPSLWYKLFPCVKVLQMSIPILQSAKE